MASHRVDDDQRSGLMSGGLFTDPTICADSLASIDPD
jgi:hypothetical protein